MGTLKGFPSPPAKSSGRAKLALRSRDHIGSLKGAPEGLLAGRGGELLDEDVVDEAVLLGLDRAHEVVALGVGLDPVERLTGVLHQQLVQLVTRPQDLL